MLKNYSVEKFITLVDQKLFNRSPSYKERYYVMDLAMKFVASNKCEGSYAEFGVFEGRTFQYAIKAAKSNNIQKMNFYAFDSFEGFSEPKSNDNIGILKSKDRACSVEKFTDNLMRFGVYPNDKIKIIKGWFADTLIKNKTNTNKLLGKDKLSVVYLDADLYEPTVEALKFIQDRIFDGTILLFDNWFLFRGNPKRGEQRAFYEWSVKQKKYTFTEFRKFGWHGNSFIVNGKLK